MRRLAGRAKVIANALDTRAETRSVRSTPDTARLARGPTRPSVSPMKLLRRMRSMPAPDPSAPGSGVAGSVPVAGTTSVTGKPSAVPGPDTSEPSPDPAASGPFILVSLRDAPLGRVSARGPVVL